MPNWKEVGTDVVTGGVAGVVDQVLKKADMDRATKAGVKQINWQKRYGTYFNFGVPILSVLAIGMGKLRGDWAIRMATIGGQLAGREGVQSAQNRNVSTSGNPVYYRPAGQQPSNIIRPNQPAVVTTNSGGIVY